MPPKTQIELEMKARIEALEAENKALRSAPVRGLTLKIGAKGGLSVYGMGRFPVTLYAEQWTKLLGQSAVITAFIKDHAAELKTKEQSTPVLKAV